MELVKKHVRMGPSKKTVVAISVLMTHMLMLIKNNALQTAQVVTRLSTNNVRSAKLTM